MVKVSWVLLFKNNIIKNIYSVYILMIPVIIFNQWSHILMVNSICSIPFFIKHICTEDILYLFEQKDIFYEILMCLTLRS